MEVTTAQSSLKIKICERLKDARIKAGFGSAKEFAEKTNLKISTYSLHEAGTRGMSIEVIEHYAGLLEINASWLLTGIGPRCKTKIREIPIITWAGIKEFINHRHQFYNEHTTSDVDLSPYSFALRVNNDTMEPRYPEGAIIIVDCEQHPRHKDFAVFQLDDKKEFTFKQLLHAEGELFAKSLNPDYPTLKLSKDARIIGKVVQAKLVC
ncbi:MAG: XRE family transcriptional regulator [Gammaproteobacteria bacterium]